MNSILSSNRSQESRASDHHLILRLITNDYIDYIDHIDYIDYFVKIDYADYIDYSPNCHSEPATPPAAE